MDNWVILASPVTRVISASLDTKMARKSYPDNIRKFAYPISTLQFEEFLDLKRNRYTVETLSGKKRRIELVEASAASLAIKNKPDI